MQIQLQYHSLIELVNRDEDTEHCKNRARVMRELKVGLASTWLLENVFVGNRETVTGQWAGITKLRSFSHIAFAQIWAICCISLP